MVFKTAENEQSINEDETESESLQKIIELGKMASVSYLNDFFN